MNTISLDWTDFDWNKFQTLSIYIAENLVPDCNFDDYLKQGQSRMALILSASIKKMAVHLQYNAKEKIELALKI